jgi:hypothetical protein
MPFLSADGMTDLVKKRAEKNTEMKKILAGLN